MPVDNKLIYFACHYVIRVEKDKNNLERRADHLKWEKVVILSNTLYHNIIFDIDIKALANKFTIRHF